jgi:hypothetical protein
MSHFRYVPYSLCLNPRVVAGDPHASFSQFPAPSPPCLPLHLVAEAPCRTGTALDAAATTLSSRWIDSDLQQKPNVYDHKLDALA